MKTFKVSNSGHARLFKSNWFEVFTISSPFLSWLTYLAIITLLLYFSVYQLRYTVFIACVIFFSGLSFWTFFEYLVHRFVFHWVSSHPKIERITYVLHGNHHHFPKDRKRLFMPIVPGLIMSSFLFGIMYLVAGTYACMFFPGFIFGHLVQSTVHFAIHSGPPPFKFLKPLWRSHQLHHYSTEEKGFGLSSTFWDHVFKTNFNLIKQKDDKIKIQSLMFDDK